MRNILPACLLEMVLFLMGLYFGFPHLRLFLTAITVGLVVANIWVFRQDIKLRLTRTGKMRLHLRHLDEPALREEQDRKEQRRAEFFAQPIFGRVTREGNTTVAKVRWPYPRKRWFMQCLSWLGKPSLVD